MTSVVPTVEAILAGFTDLPRISGEPTFEDIAIARQHLNHNCMNIQSYGRKDKHGHLGLVMMEVEYLMQLPGVSGYTRPPNPGATAEISDAATPVASKILIQEHGEERRAYRLAKNIDKACCKAILDAFGDKFLAARADPIVHNANEMAILLLTHLKECYIHFTH
jgi:hypothetical protein